MNIVFYHYSLGAGGAERTITHFANYLAEAGDQVTIVTTKAEPSFYPLHDSVTLLGLGTDRVSRHPLEAVGNHLRAMGRLRQALGRIHPDVVVCMGPSTLLPAWIVRGRLQYRLVGSERTNPYLDQGGFWNRIKRWISTRCDGFFFQTEGAMGYYPETTRRKARVIPNAVEAQTYALADRPWEERANICAISRLVEEKCIPEIIRAFAKARETYPDAVLDIYGDGPQEETLRALCRELSLTDAVAFPGRCRNAPQVDSLHRIFVTANAFDGMPNSLMEAMASGCACIASDCDFGPSELIRDGENGFLVPLHDVDAIADRLCRLLADDQLAREMGERAMEIRKTHDVGALGERLRKYLLALTGNS